MARFPSSIPLPTITCEGAAAALGNLPGFAFLDARVAPTPQDRFSIIGVLPDATFHLAGGFVTVDGHTTIANPREALLAFAKRLDALPHDPALPFSGGLIGTIGFEGAAALRGFAPARGFSRHPQCRFGLYPAALLFDHMEGSARLVTDDPEGRTAQQILERLQRIDAPTKHHRRSSAAGPSSRRMSAGDALRAEAQRWLRAEAATRLHLAHHERCPDDGGDPAAIDEAPALHAEVTYEGARYRLASRETLLETRGERVCSTLVLADERGWRAIAHEQEEGLLRICERSTLARRAMPAHGAHRITFTGTRRPEMHPIDGLIGLIPSPSVAGAPLDRAMAFIDRHEPEHRALYGGVFGFADAGGCTFQTTQSCALVADGMIRTTTGETLTA